MEERQTKNVLEACLLVAGRAMPIAQLEALFEEDIDRPDRKAIRAALSGLADEYAERGIELVEVAGGWRLQTRAAMEHWVARLTAEKPPRYSRALLETLVLIAYRQPITRGEIEEVRGVAVSSNIVRTLQERRWVREVGHKDVPGRPALLGTTGEFLDYFNLKRLDELPPLGELKDLDRIEAVLAAELGVVDEGGDAANDGGVADAGEAAEVGTAEAKGGAADDGDVVDDAEPTEKVVADAASGAAGEAETAEAGVDDESRAPSATAAAAGEEHARTPDDVDEGPPAVGVRADEGGSAAAEGGAEGGAEDGLEDGAAVSVVGEESSEAGGGEHRRDEASTASRDRPGDGVTISDVGPARADVPSSERATSVGVSSPGAETDDGTVDGRTDGADETDEIADAAVDAPRETARGATAALSMAAIAARHAPIEPPGDGTARSRAKRAVDEDTAAVAAGNGTEPRRDEHPAPGDAQASMMRAVDEFAEEHRRELDARAALERRDAAATPLPDPRRDPGRASDDRDDAADGFT